jgi:protein-tyrosine-phosphatase
MAQQREKSVLFLCTGNYYRNRFAEIFFNSVAGRMGLPWKAFSKGLALERGVNNVGPMELSAVKALEVLGVRLPSPWLVFHSRPRQTISSQPIGSSL